MLDFLKPKQSWLPAIAVDCLTPLLFKDSVAAFQHACGMEYPLHEGIVLPAIVLDARELFGAVTAVMVLDNGRQVACIRVSSADGGFIVCAQTNGSRGPVLEPGRLVAWQAGRYDPQHNSVASGQVNRSRWVGLIESTLKSE